MTTHLEIIGVEPEDIKTMNVELTETVASKIDTLIERVLGELKDLGIEPQPKV